MLKHIKINLTRVIKSFFYEQVSFLFLSFDHDAV
jgi:hypothetical protein